VLRFADAEREHWVGILTRHGVSAFVTPYRDDATWRVAIGARDLGGAEDGEVVVVEPLRGGRGPRGRVLEVLGRPGAPEADFRAVVWRRGLRTRFPAEADAAAAALAERPDRGEVRRRVDLRDLPFVTIDPASARDHDDAVCVEGRPGGEARLRVAIADVSHYVPPGSELDGEALRRGNSVYFPDRAIPMLPARLSSLVCSLLPGVDRLALVAELDVDAGGRVGHRAFYPAVIRSRARLAYDDAALAMQGDAAVRAALGADVAAQLDALAGVASDLSRHRFAQGSLDFDLPTAEIVLSPAGMPTGVALAPRTPAHRAIEEAMLAANREVAELLFAAAAPALYRNHEPPAREDAEALARLLARLGLLEGSAEAELTPRRLARALARLDGRPEETLVHRTVLRRMRQARYGARSLGHFALGFRHYVHFTSPIRRYSDLVTHRVLKAVIGESAVAPVASRGLDAIANRISFTERVAEAAEREMIEIKKCVFIAERVGEVFDGSVTGVARHGLYVTLDGAFVEGLLHISALDRGLFFDEEAMALVARRSGRGHRLGDRLRVRLAHVDPVRTRIDLALLPDDGSRRRVRGQRAARRRSISDSSL
jgi:ribonuclease R